MGGVGHLTLLVVYLARQVSGLEMRKWMDELFPIIMDMLQDSSSLAKRQVWRNLISDSIC